MELNKKEIVLRIDDKNSYPSNSITTASLMTVLSGTFFITLITTTNSNLYLFSHEKFVVLFLIFVSIILFIKSIELTIDIFHFTNNNDSKEELEFKFKKELIYYNSGVVILIFSIVYLMLENILLAMNCTKCFCTLFILYLSILILTYFISTKWIKDLIFVIKNKIEIKTTN